MANLALGWPNRIDDATVTATSSVVGLPVTNLQDKRITRVWRSGDCTGGPIVIDIDLGFAMAIQAVSLHNTNLSAAATVRVIAGPSAGSSAAMDSGTFSVQQMPLEAGTVMWEDAGWWEGSGAQWLRNVHPIIYAAPAQVTARYVQITINNTTNPDGYLQAGRICCSPLLIPRYNDVYPRVDGFTDLTTFAKPGARFAQHGSKPKRVELSLARWSLAEVRYLRGISRQDGADADVLYLPNVGDPAANQEFGFLGTITSGLDAISRAGFDFHAGRITIEERL